MLYIGIVHECPEKSAAVYQDLAVLILGQMISSATADHTYEDVLKCVPRVSTVKCDRSEWRGLFFHRQLQNTCQ